MIRNLLATTALATLVATGAYAQSTNAPAPAAPMAQEAPAEGVVRADGHLASNIIGETVYNGAGDDAENIGEVKDIILSADGRMESVVVGVGGFLGLGEKQVVVSTESLEWAERDGDRWLIIPTTKEQLEQLSEFDPAPYEAAPATVAGADSSMPADQTAGAPAMAPAPADQATESQTAVVPVAPADGESTTATADAPMAPADGAETANVPTTPTDGGQATETADAPVDGATVAPSDSAATAEAPATGDRVGTDTTTTAAIDRSQLTAVPMEEIRAEELIGTTVSGANEENIGEIGDVILTQDGQIDSYIVDVGGFLGMGEKEVAVGSDNLTFMADQNGTTYLYTSFSKEQLEAAPAYDESSWAENRDEQRVIAQ